MTDDRDVPPDVLFYDARYDEETGVQPRRSAALARIFARAARAESQRQLAHARYEKIVEALEARGVSFGPGRPDQDHAANRVEAPRAWARWFEEHAEALPAELDE